MARRSTRATKGKRKKLVGMAKQMKKRGLPKGVHKLMRGIKRSNPSWSEDRVRRTAISRAKYLRTRGKKASTRRRYASATRHWSTSKRLARKG